MNKTFITAIVAFGLGFASNIFFSKSNSYQSIKDPKTISYENFASARSSLISISQNEYVEYTKIKDQKKKYEKADELLTKIMLLFLADVGFKVSKEVPAELSATRDELKTQPISTPRSGVSQVPSENPGSGNLALPSGSNLADKSSMIKNLATEKQIHEALDTAVIENPKIESVQGTVPSHKQIQLLDGKYYGTIRFLDGKREELSVSLDLMPDYSKSGLSGAFKLLIHGPEKNSESSGQGNIHNIVSLSQDQGGFLISGCGDECFLQLYYNSPSDQLFGNYYEITKSSNKKPERVGLVNLRK